MILAKPVICFTAVNLSRKIGLCYGKIGLALGSELVDCVDGDGGEFEAEDSTSTGRGREDFALDTPTLVPEEDILFEVGKIGDECALENRVYLPASLSAIVDVADMMSGERFFATACAAESEENIRFATNAAESAANATKSDGQTIAQRSTSLPLLPIMGLRRFRGTLSRQRSNTIAFCSPDLVCIFWELRPRNWRACY